MKDTHLYQRLNNLNAVKTFMNMIKTGEKQIADELFDLILLCMAHTLPNLSTYAALMLSYFG